MTRERFRHLLQLYKTEQLSQTEWEEFRDGLQTEDYKDIVDSEIEGTLARFETHETWTPALSRELWLNTVERTGHPPHKVVSMPVRRKKLYRALAVAAACLTIAVAAYLLRPHQRTSPHPLAASFSPGGNKAVLTLGDGTRIILDNAADGVLAQRNGMRIEKLATGQVAYQATGKADSKISWNTMETPRGGEYQLQLPDGTKVWLNSASSITYPDRFTGAERQVQIKGEAYFEIAKNAKQPFTVSTGKINVHVLGTSFNIMAYPDEDAIGTTLVEGAVKVENDKIDALVQPGEQLNWTPGQTDFERTRPDLRNVLAWKEGKFRFNGIRIGAIMRQIARWYDVDVEYEGKMPDNEFAGSLPRKQYASEILEALEATRNVHFEMKGRKILVYPGPRE